MKRLIVNADDFGLSPGVNRAVCRAAREGILTSATLLANMEGFGEAAAGAAEDGVLSLGIHLNLTLGRPLSKPEEVPGLVRPDGSFLHPPDFYRKILFGKIEREELEREIRSQIEKMISAGLRPTHIDSHKHLHVHPAILDVTIRLAAEYGVRRARLPAEPPRFLALAGPPPRGALARSLLVRLLAARAKRVFRRHGIAYPDRFFGIAWAGRIDEGVIIALLRRLPEGTTELSCHPGEKEELSGHPLWLTEREGELRALLSPAVREAVEAEGVRLIGYRELETAE